MSGPVFAMTAVGVDVVSVATVQSSLETFGEAYLARIYTPGEIAYARSSPSAMAERLAARYAAKEAVRKILSPTEGLDFRAVEVIRNEHGAPALLLTGTALELAHRIRALRWSLSLSHDAGVAVAVVALTHLEP